MKARTCFLPVLGDRVEKHQCTINIPHGFELGEKDGTLGLVRNGSAAGLGVDWRNHIGDPTLGELRYESHADDPVWPLLGKKPHNSIGPINSAGEDLPEPKSPPDSVFSVDAAPSAAEGRPRRESAVGEAEELVDFIRQEVSEIMATRPANEIVVRVVVEDRRNG